MNFAECLSIVRCDLTSRAQVLNLSNLFKDPISRFHLYLRLTEYLATKKRSNVFLSPLYYFTKWRFQSLSARLGFSIPENTLGKGVYLPHYGTIVVNSKAYVGDYSVLNVDVVLGRHPSSKDAVPVLGRGVFVGPGVKVFGDANIGSHSVIGANSVVSSTIPAQQLWAGSPASFKRVIELPEYKQFVGVEKAWKDWGESSS